MAGHSKWANIKHRKAAQDAKRGKIFTKLIRELVVAAKMGGAVIEDNPRLRAAVDKALRNNMKKDTIEKAIARGAGQDEADNYEEIRYEGYGPGGVAIMVDCLTDNRQRTVSEVRHAFSKRGGNLGTDGSVAYMFKRVGLISFEPGVGEDALMEAAIEAGADDVVVNDDGSVDVITTPENYMDVLTALEETGFKPVQADISMEADVKAEITDPEQAQKVMALIDALEDLDDVQRVYSNVDIPDEVMEKIA
ncbi:DNA-binding regulatory protein, YebC/PmpR family [Sulfurivirga caldicuralii]|uniref:Probable transcriptional regulatory protein SAMN05443662_0713 n=1 Tax=Sulfurivirga caldicuralii TaxID=364032 RepID=A0A1N6EQ15_9GAMM|nr:YebC/PmpR family DNA-binding transcriptional regulator [Sulfurivirga caldicuralii]SIN85098.1 DNA-binding regulatory protein, YebC/PmpR family [Sulfurivirga caldicuralii]